MHTHIHTQLPDDDIVVLMHELYSMQFWLALV